MRWLFANLGLQAMSIHLQSINHTMQFIECSAPYLTFCSFMQTGTQFTWKTSFSFVDVKIEELTLGLPAFPLLIQNFAMMNGQCEQTNHRYSLSVLLRICIIPSYNYRSAPSVAAQIPIVPGLFVQNPFDQLLRNWLRLILQEALLYMNTKFFKYQKQNFCLK